MSLIRRIRAFYRWSLDEKWLFLKAMAYIFFYCLVVYVFPSKKLRNYLGIPGEFPHNRESEVITREKVVLALRRAMRVLRISKICLVYALSGKKILLNKGIGSTLYLGMKKEKGKRFAHAWLFSQGHPIVGCEEKEQYTIVGTFHSPLKDQR